MTQTALNGRLALPADQWTKVSEVNCTFTVEVGTVVELLGTDGGAPAADDEGITYRLGQGEDKDYDLLSKFTGAGTADGLYAISRNEDGELFVSRAAVA